MAKSIRWRLQFWYAVVLLAVVSGFAIYLYYEVRAARYRDIDADLVVAVNYLDSTLRTWPHEVLEGSGNGNHNPASSRPITGVSEFRLLTFTPAGWPVVDESSDRYFAVWRADGSTIRSVGLPAGQKPEQLPLSSGLVTGGDPLSPPKTDRHLIRTRGDAREIAKQGPSQTQILVGIKTDKIAAEMRAFAWQLSISGAVVLCVGLAGGWWVSSRLLQPIARITATASRISATNLSERIEAKDVDKELAELAEVLNAAFHRLESAFEQLTRFTADASHELRTPLAILKSNTELALSRPRSEPEYRQALETCAQAADRMTTLVEGLLTLARADVGRLDLRQTPVDLAKIVEDTSSLLRPLAETKSIAVQLELKPVRLLGDLAGLSLVVRNLIENAIRYNREGGKVRIRLGQNSREAILGVADTGLGIPEADLPHLFERFYRVDKARSRASGGTGLGLAICKSIVEAHGGRIDFKSREGKGTEFVVALPIRTEV
ncbi:MAG TPA: ATP-binding protein [Gemmataceae bacterium]|jgi:heavy metal sensor kinase|nr:ATP-binding protein [Gemmataceae bacterium]